MLKYSEIMLLSLYTGMRIGECCALTVEDINLDEKMIIISKTVARGESGKHTIHDTKTQAGMSLSGFSVIILSLIAFLNTVPNN